jgi:sarcosine oxidase subunit beta
VSRAQSLMERRSASSAPGDDEAIVVIGAGSTGSSTAYNLAKAGRRVVVIDKGQVASGMTGLSTAIVRTHYSNELVAGMALYSLNMLSNFQQIGESGFARTGMVFLATPEHVEGLTRNLPMLDRVGVKSEAIKLDEAGKRFPDLNFDGCGGVVYEPESGYADPSAVTNSYARAAQKLGATLMPGETAVRIEPGGGHPVVQLAGGSHIRCSKVVLCTNVWSNGLLRASGVAEADLPPIISSVHPVVVYRRPEMYRGNKPVVLDDPAKAYYKPDGQALLVVGSLDPVLDERDSDPDLMPSRASPDLVERLTQAVVSRVAAMGEGSLQSTFNGMYDMTPDQHPIVDELASIGLPGIYCCVGLSGHGFKLCPALGVMTAQMVMGVEPDLMVFDNRQFSLSRFKEGRLLTSSYAGLATVA